MTAQASRTIVFSHANGFPAGVYRVLFEVWRAAGWRVEAVDMFGHDQRFPVTSNWPHLRAQLIDFIDTQVKQPAVLVGHSLGGLLSLMVACKRPDLAAGLVMLDSPVFSGWRAHSLHMFKVSGLVQRAGPGHISKRRRHEWPSHDAVLAHFAPKSAFARWDPRVLADYVQAGFVEENGRTVLRFKREIETRIYNTLPHTLGPMLRKSPPRCPVAFIAGRQSAEMRQGGVEGARALAKERFVWTDGTHLYPMERPEETAASVLSLIDATT